MGTRVLTACSFRSKSIPQQVFHRCRSAEALRLFRVPAVYLTSAFLWFFSIFRCRKRWSDPRASPTCRHLRSCPLAEPSALSYLESTHAKDSKFAPLTPFRINTCRSTSKQRTLTPFRMNTYEKQGGEGPVIVRGCRR